MQETPTPEPIGSIDGAYVGALMLLIALSFGCAIGGFAVYYLLRFLH